MVRKFGIEHNSTQWPNGKKSSIFSIFLDPFPFIEKTKNNELDFVNQGTTTRENLKQIRLLLRMTY